MPLSHQSAAWHLERKQGMAPLALRLNTAKRSRKSTLLTHLNKNANIMQNLFSMKTEPDAIATVHHQTYPKMNKVNY